MQVLLSVMFAGCAVNALLFLAVPTAREFVHYPANLSVAVGCSSPSLLLHDLDSRSCQYQHNWTSAFNLTITECGYVCYQDDIRAESQPEATIPADWLPSMQNSTRKFRKASVLPDAWKLNVSCNGDLCRLSQGAGSDPFRMDEVEFSTNWTIGSFKLNGDTYNRFECDTYDQPIRFSGNFCQISTSICSLKINYS